MLFRKPWHFVLYDVSKQGYKKSCEHFRVEWKETRSYIITYCVNL